MCFIFISGHGAVDTTSFIEIQKEQKDDDYKLIDTDYTLYFAVDEKELLFAGHGNTIMLTAVKTNAVDLISLLEKNPATLKANKDLKKCIIPPTAFFLSFNQSKKTTTKTTAQNIVQEHEKKLVIHDHKLTALSPSDPKNDLFLFLTNKFAKQGVNYKSFKLSSNLASLDLMNNMYFVFDENLLQKTFVEKMKTTWEKNKKPDTFEVPKEALIQAYLDKLPNKGDHLKLSVLIKQMHKVRIGCVIQLQPNTRNTRLFEIQHVYLEQKENKVLELLSPKKQFDLLANPSQQRYYVEFILPKDASLYWDACRA